MDQHLLCDFRSADWPAGGHGADFPWNGSFWDGLLGPLFLPHKSVFLFDPLLILLIMLVVGSWSSVRLILRLWMGTLLAMFVTYLFFYSRHFWWGADPAWGCRYHLLPVWFICLVTLPLLAEVWESLGWPRKVFATTIIVVAIVVQLAALVFHYNLEDVQGRRLFILGRRFVNIVALASGNFRQWGLDTGNPSDLEPVVVPNLVPFRLAYRHQHSLALAAWPVMIFFILITVFQLAALLRSMKHREVGPGGRGGIGYKGS